MARILFVTFYDMICVGQRILSSLAKIEGVETHVVIFKDQKGRPIFRDQADYQSYQFYIGGIKHGSGYASYPYTKKEVKLFVDLVAEIRPDVIAYSTRTFGIEVWTEIYQALKARPDLADIPIIGGGWGPTLELDRFLAVGDYVAFGEGEKTIQQIARQLKAGSSDFHNIANLAYKDETGRLVQNPVSEPYSALDLNDLPFPDYEPENKYLIDDNKIRRHGVFYNPRIYNCFAGRGCMLNCSYCMSSKYTMLYRRHDLTIQRFRVRSVERVIEELRWAKDQGAMFIRMADEILPAKKEWLDPFIEAYGKHIDLPFFAYVRPEFHKPEVIRRLVDVGLSTSIVGIQSGSEQIRKEIFKRMLGKDKLIRFAETMHELGVEFSYNLINFNPFETDAHMTETLHFLTQLPFAPMIVFRLVPFPGAPIYNMIQEQKPVALPDPVQKWYGYLYTMATKGPRWRKLALDIHKSERFRDNPAPLAMLFWPEYANFYGGQFARKLKYGSSMMIRMPLRRPAERRVTNENPTA